MKKPKKHDHILIPILGTIGDNGVIVWAGDDEKYEAKRTLAAARRRNFPDPIIYFDKRLKYTKARCPECKEECLLRGYNMHYDRRHNKNTNYKSRKGIKLKPYNHFEGRESQVREDPHVETFDPESWKKRHEASMEAILKKYR